MECSEAAAIIAVGPGVSGKVMRTFSVLLKVMGGAECVTKDQGKLSCVSKGQGVGLDSLLSLGVILIDFDLSFEELNCCLM